MTSMRAARLAGDARWWVTSTNNLPAGLVHWRESRELPHRNPKGVHGVGHHLPMTDGHEDVIASVLSGGNGEQRGDGPALDDVEVTVGQTPLDVLGVTEVLLDLPSQLGEPHGMGICQHGLLLPLSVDHLFLRATGRQAMNSQSLHAHRPGHDCAVADFVDVRVHEASDERLAETESCLHGDNPPVRGDGVGREQDTGRLREHHVLHDHAHLDRPVVEPVRQSIGHGPLGED